MDLLYFVFVSCLLKENEKKNIKLYGCGTREDLGGETRYYILYFSYKNVLFRKVKCPKLAVV